MRGIASLCDRLISHVRRFPAHPEVRIPEPLHQQRDRARIAQPAGDPAGVDSACHRPTAQPRDLARGEPRGPEDLAHPCRRGRRDVWKRLEAGDEQDARVAAGQPRQPLELRRGRIPLGPIRELRPKDFPQPRRAGVPAAVPAVDE